MRLVDLDTKVTTWRYNFDKEEYVAVQTTVGEMIDLDTLEGLSVPIIEIKEPHGRLGDLDKLEQMFVDIDNAPYSGFDGEEPFYSAEDAAQIIRLAPTVIPASEDGIHEAQRDYQAAADYQQYCETYEQTYDPETGAM